MSQLISYFLRDVFKSFIFLIMNVHFLCFIDKMLRVGSIGLIYDAVSVGNYITTFLGNSVSSSSSISQSY